MSYQELTPSLVQQKKGKHFLNSIAEVNEAEESEESFDTQASSKPWVQLSEERQKNFGLSKKLEKLLVILEETEENARQRESTLKREIQEKDSLLRKAQLEIERLNTCLKEQGQNFVPVVRNKVEDEVDTKLKKELAELGMNKLLTKEEPNIYSFGRRKIFVDLKDGTLVCRIGPAWKTLPEFIKYYADEIDLLKTYPHKRAVSSVYQKRRIPTTRKPSNPIFPSQLNGLY